MGWLPDLPSPDGTPLLSVAWPNLLCVTDEGVEDCQLLHAPLAAPDSDIFQNLVFRLAALVARDDESQRRDGEALFLVSWFIRSYVCLHVC